MNNCTSQELKNKQVINFLIEDRFRILRHAGFLIGLLSLFYFSDFPDQFYGIYKYYSLFFVYMVFLAMFYINMYVLVPYFFFKVHYLPYCALLFLVIISGMLLSTYTLKLLIPYRIDSIPPPKHTSGGYVESAIIIGPIILLTTTIKLLQRWIRDNERISALKNATLNMELRELKNQINPHFLFNMLNNVKALIRTDPEKASFVILKLSEFLRYQLYDNNDEKTALSTEIHFIENFLNLEKIRRDNFTFKIINHTENNLLKRVFLPPNLFTTFVENAIKHSVDMNGEASSITIELRMENKMLYFVCTNSKSKDDISNDHLYGGLGLINIQRRLELLFQNRYTLGMIADDDKYTVNLMIPL